MSEWISDELAADAAAFATALPASVEMPAGTGKTHLLAATAKHLLELGGHVLVLTHTNAGVYAVKNRIKRFGVTRDVYVSTITSFAFRLARSYPNLGGLSITSTMVPEHSKDYIDAATRVAMHRHVQDVLRASFTHVLVDEYQDCNESHHALVSAIRESIPKVGVLGDPLQAIFGFNERLVDWNQVVAEYPPHRVTIRPWRWSGHNEELGAWLLNIRPLMVPNHVVDWTNIALPYGVRFQNIGGNPRGVTQAAFARYPADETVLIISARSASARNIAGNLNGAFTVMEEVAGKFMAQKLTNLVNATPGQYALWLFDLAKACHCGHGVLDTRTLRKRYQSGRTASDLLKSGAGKRVGAEIAIKAFDSVVLTPTLASVASAMDEIPRSAALRLHSHEAWYDIQESIRGAVAHGNDAAMLLEELAKAREVFRNAGRHERTRIISRTLLVKGLEYDHVIISDVRDHAGVSDLYVALSRARKSITILGSENTLLLQPSPNGR